MLLQEFRCILENNGEAGKGCFPSFRQTTYSANSSINNKFKIGRVRYGPL